MIGLSILLALVLYVWLARFVARRMENRVTKYIVIAIFIFVPLWDVIPGKLYFNHLCATEAGTTVYSAIELPAEYWDAQGNPRFFNEYGDLERGFRVKWLDESSGHVERYSSVFAVDKDTSPVKEKGSQRVLAEIITFRYWGGWVARHLSPHNTANSCEFIGDSNFSISLYSQLFKPAFSSE